MTSSTEGKGSMTESEAEALKKKSLSKYGPFNQSIHASRGNDSDEEYGIVVPEEGDDDVKFNKKSLSKFASHSVDPTVTKKSEDDDDYGAFDPTFKLEKVAHTAKGELVVVPENTTPKTIKKTLSKYGTPSSVQKTPASVRSADSDDDYGALESNGQPKKIKKTLSKYSPKNSTNKLEGKLSFEEIKVDSDEEYGELDPNFKPVPVAVTSSGHFVVPPEPTSEKKIKKTLSKYRDSSMSAEKPVTVSSTAGVDVLKSRDSDEEYGNDIDTSYLDSAKAKSRKTVHQNSSASKSHSISQSHSISVSKSRSDDTTFSNGEVSTEHLAPVKALVAKIEKNKGGAGVTNKDLAAVEQKENPNNLNVPSTDSLDMSLNALKVQELSRSSSHNNSFIQVEQSSEVKGQSTELSYEDQLISLISKGYTRDQAEEFIHMTKTAKTKKASASRSQSFENSFPQNAMSSTSSMNSASQAPFSSVTAPKRVPSSGLYPSPAYPSQYPSQLYAPTQGQRQTGIDGLVARGYTLEQATAIYESTLLFRSPSGDQGAPTQYYPVYYPPGYYVASPTHGIMQPEQPSLPLNTPPPPPPPHFNPYMPNSPFNNVHDDDEKALKIAILLSEQEAEFGVNMYQVVTKKDEMEVQALLNRGFTVDEAILWIFEKRGYCSNKSIADNKSDTVNQGSNGDEISASTLTHSFISESPGEGRRRQKSKSDLDTSQEHKSNDDIRSRSKESEVGVSPADKKMSQERSKRGKKLRSIFSFGGSGASSKTNSNVNSPANSRVNSGDNTGSATKNQHHHKTPEEKEIQKVLKYKDKDVKVITELGFSREQAVQALVENDHNVTMATNYLISSLNDLDVASRNRERRINRSQSDGSHNSHNSSYNSLPVPMIAPGPYAPYPMMYYAPYPGTIPSSLAPSFDNQIMMYPPPPNNSYSVPASHSGSFYQQSLYQQGVSATNSPANLLRTGSTTGIANASHSNHSSFYDVDPNERVLYNRALSSSNDSFQSDPRKKKSGSSNSANNTPSASFYNSRNGTIQQLPPTHMSR